MRENAVAFLVGLWAGRVLPSITTHLIYLGIIMVLILKTYVKVG